MTEKNEPKIRMVTLDKKFPAGEGDKQDKGCCKEVCPCPCVNESCFCEPVDCGCMCVRVGDPPFPCSCVDHVPPPSCPCVDHPPSCPCLYEVPCSQTTIPSNPKSENNQKEQKTPKEGKGKPRTFFKIADKK